MQLPKPNRGEIWLVNLDPGTVGHEQGKQRPCLVISHDRINHGNSEIVIVLPITSTERKIPFHLEVAPRESGLDHTSYILCDGIRSISVKRLVERRSRVPRATLLKVEQLLSAVLALPKP